MKRLALIVSAIAMTATAYAQDATEFKNGGEFRVRYENFFNKSGMDNSMPEQHTDARLKWDMNIRKGEKLQAHVTLLHNARFGGAASNADYYDNGYTVAASSNNVLNVNRAWGWWRATDAVSFKVGRIGIEFADGAVFSENDWQAVPVAHEGLDIAFDTSFAMFNLYGIKTREAVTSNASTGYVGNSDPEANYYMLTADLKNMPSAIKMANVHLIDLMDDGAAATTGTTNLQHIGATVGGDVAVSAGYHMDSGDDNATDDKNNAYNPLFYDRHNYAGLMDVLTWGNLTYYNINASIMPMEDLEAGLGVYMFSKTKSGGGTTFGRGIASGATTSNDSPIGSEVDLFANKSYGPDLKIGARYSMFMEGDAMKNAPVKREKMAHEAYLQASIAF
jgi:hypothetical protein